MSNERPVEPSLLRAFSPLDGLKNENVRALARKTQLRELGQGRLLFKEGDTDKRTYYLASGIVELLTGGRIVSTIRGGTPDATHALAPILPRRCTARVASEKIEYLSIAGGLLLTGLGLWWAERGAAVLWRSEAEEPGSASTPLVPFGAVDRCATFSR